MRRRLNVKFLIVLVGVTILLGGGISLLHRSQVKRSAAGLLRQANRAEKTWFVRPLRKEL